MLFISFLFAFLVLFPSVLICTSPGFFTVKKFWNYSSVYELPTGDSWASKLWLSHWRKGMWHVRKGGKVSFRGFCSAGLQGSKWGPGVKVTPATHRHTQPLPSADCQFWGDGEPMTELEKTLHKMSLTHNFPSCAMTTDCPKNLHAHTVSRYFANNWLAEVSTYNYLTEEKERLIETHPRLHT